MIKAEDLVLSGPSALPEGEVKRAVIFFHGYGANGHDLFGLSSFLKWAFPQTAFYFPNAPKAMQGMELFGGREWFDLSSYDPSALTNKQEIERLCKEMLAGAEQARFVTDKYVAQVQELHGLKASQMGVVGFSQGGLMAVYTALRYQEVLGAVVGLSGVAVTFDDVVFSMKDIASKPHVTLVHGDADNIVPLSVYRLNLANLEQAGVPVQGFVVPDLMHGIDDTAMFHLKNALREGFKIQ